MQDCSADLEMQVRATAGSPFTDTTCCRFRLSGIAGLKSRASSANLAASDEFVARTLGSMAALLACSHLIASSQNRAQASVPAQTT